MQQTVEGVQAVKIDQPFEIPLAPETKFSGNVAKFSGVKLGSGYYCFDATVNAPADFSGKLEVRLDAADGPLVGTCLLKPDWLKARQGLVDTFIRDANDTRDAYLVLKPNADTDALGVRLATARFFADRRSEQNQ